jgi:hypothetical protein
MNLTPQHVAMAKAKNKIYRLYDGDCLHLEITPASGKLWRYKYKFNGKDQKLSLGCYPEIGLYEARERRDRLKKLVKSGINPSIERKKDKLNIKKSTEKDTLLITILKELKKIYPIVQDVDKRLFNIEKIILDIKMGSNE